MPSWKKVIISGSNAALNSLTVTNGITGSLFGTASYANFAATASNAQNAQDILIYVKNVTGAQIDKGKVVRISGATGDNALIATASYTDDANSANTLGITYQNIPNDSFGYVITEGTLIGIDTSTPGWTAGQLLYLGATGSIIGTAPVAPLHAVRLGQVLRVQAINGSMYVRIDNGYELGELHDVVDTTTTSSFGDLLVKSGSVWINSKQLTGSYGLTGSLNATSFTGSLFGTASVASTSIITTQDTTPVTYNVVFTGGTSGNQSLNVDATTLTYNPSTTTFTCPNLAGTATSASQAATASFVTTLNQSILITGSTTIGATSAGASENTLTLGPSLAGGAGEGGQIGFNAVGGIYTSASFIDNWQNKVRILRGTNAGSTGLVAQWDLHNLQMQLPQYTNASSFAGTATANLAVDSSGNVITVSTSGAPVFPYVGNAVITGSLTTTGIIYAQPNGGMYFQGGDDAALYDINVVNTMGIYGVQNSTVGAVKLGSSGPVLYGSGSNLGINTTTPYSPLQVGNYTGTGGYSYGLAATFMNSFNVSRTTLFLGTTDTTSTQDKGGSIAFGGGSEAGSTPYTFAQIKGLKEVSGGGYNGYMAFYTTPAGSDANTERMRINSVGYVGIATTNPSYPLHVSASASGTSIYATGDIVAFSDQSVKENIRPIENVLERIGDSRGVLYDRVDNGEKDNIGFIAQELEVAFPELVVTNPDGTKAVKYQNAVAVLFEAIKEQQKQINSILKLLDK